jgi:radical SAM protein with 4Fe4S-binding SPASM domain
VMAVLPDGSVVPCPMARWLSIGNVRDHPLPALVRSSRARAVRAAIASSASRSRNCASGSGGGGCLPS